MKRNQSSKICFALVLAVGLQAAIAAPARGIPMYKIVGLTSDNTIVPYGNNSRSAKQVEIKGVDGNVLGIDFRPANGMLYAITDTDKIYTVNTENGAAKYVSTLSVSFSGGFQSGVDFNPVADRLRLVANNGQNFRVNVDTGAVIVDGNLSYTAEQSLGITAAAYTNSKAGATTTTLYNLDYDADTLVIQNPPNDGTLKTVGALGLNLPPIAGFDIVINGTQNAGFFVSGRSLYTVDLSTGKAGFMGKFRQGNLIGVAASLGANRN